MRMLIGFLLVAVLAPPVAWAGGDDELVGVWVTEENKARVEVTKKDGVYRGTIIWLKDLDYPADDKDAGTPKHDRENPDESKRGGPIIGLEILKGFREKGDKLYDKGTIYDPDNGKTYKCKMEIRDDGHLYVRGFIGISLLGRTTVWTRYVEPEAGPAAESKESGAGKGDATEAESAR